MENTPDHTTCDNPDCTEPTPLDMPAVVIQNSEYCSPDCAHTQLDTHTNVSRVVLRDPQFHVDRTDLPGVSDEHVDIHREIEDRDDLELALDEIDGMYPTEFRVTVDERVNLKVNTHTKHQLDSVKQEGETWDECFNRLVRLHRATELD